MLDNPFSFVPGTHHESSDICMTGNQGWTIVALELQKLGTIDDARNDFAHIERDTRISWNHTQQLFCVIVGLHRAPAATCKSLLRIAIGPDLPSYTHCIPLI